MNARVPPPRGAQWLFLIGHANQSKPDRYALEALKRRQADPDLATLLELMPPAGDSIELSEFLPRSPFKLGKTHLLLGQLICSKIIILRKDNLSQTTWLRRAPTPMKER